MWYASDGPTRTPRVSELTDLRVEAAGYEPWALAFRDGGTGKRLEGPVRMVPAEPSGAATQSLSTKMIVS